MPTGDDREEQATRAVRTDALTNRWRHISFDAYASGWRAA
jgi:hypothetical protein